MEATFEGAANGETAANGLAADQREMLVCRRPIHTRY